MTTPKKVLGRGLGALIPQKDDRSASATEVDVDAEDYPDRNPQTGQ